MSSAEIPTRSLDNAPTPRDDYDSPWKEISGRFFPELVDFFAPDLHAIIDWPAQAMSCWSKNCGRCYATLRPVLAGSTKSSKSER